jgi:hypothetical protein
MHKVEIVGRPIKGALLVKGMPKQRRERYLGLIEEMKYAGYTDAEIIVAIRAGATEIGELF